MSLVPDIFVVPEAAVGAQMLEARLTRGLIRSKLCRSRWV